MTERDRKAWRLGFLECFKLLGDQSAISMRDLTLYLNPPDEWPLADPPVTRKGK